MAQVQRKIVHKQFNSPIALYSDTNVKETLDRELKLLNNGAVGWVWNVFSQIFTHLHFNHKILFPFPSSPGFCSSLHSFCRIRKIHLKQKGFSWLKIKFLLIWSNSHFITSGRNKRDILTKSFNEENWVIVRVVNRVFMERYH